MEVVLEHISRDVGSSPASPLWVQYAYSTRVIWVSSVRFPVLAAFVLCAPHPPEFHQNKLLEDG